MTDRRRKVIYKRRVKRAAFLKAKIEINNNEYEMNENYVRWHSEFVKLEAEIKEHHKILFGKEPY